MIPAPEQSPQMSRREAEIALGIAALRLPLRGYLRASTSIGPRLLDPSTGSLHLGRDVGFTRYFGGAIDEAVVYDRILDPSEIMTLAAGFDDDADGLPDDYERGIIENSPGFHILADVQPGDDLDGDGSDNADEWLAGTNPLDPKDSFHIGSWEITPSGGSRAMLVTIAGRAGRSYTLVGSATLAEPWITVDSTGPLPSDQPVVLEWHNLPESRAFVRVRVDFTPVHPIPD